uniref:hypothetical protein n=1 Tax=Flavobacterium sp. TaxID=239 RepID=UPI00404B4D83
MRKLIVMIFLIGFFISNGQEIILNENLNVDETNLVIEVFPDTEEYYKHIHSFYLSRDFCFDGKLNVFFNTKHLSFFSFNIGFKNNTIKPELKLISDYNEYDNMHSKTLTLYGYRLEINTLNPNLGDAIKGTIQAKLTAMVNGTIRYFKISGTFRHIVGKILINNEVDEFLTKLYEKKREE